MNRLLSHCTYPKISNLLRGAKWCPIGMDLGNDGLQVAQLANKSKVVNLIAGGSKQKPANVETGSVEWQRWAIDTIYELTANNNFKCKEVIAALPSSDVFIDHIKLPKTNKKNEKEDALVSKLKSKLPIEPEEAVIKYIPTEGDNMMVIATEREKINRHLAIYEQAQLPIKSIAVWPMALANSYVKFFGRRKTDIEAIVLLVDIRQNYTNVVICRHKNLLFAHSISIGAEQLQSEEITTRLVLELTGCRRQFNSIYGIAQIERMIFLSGQVVDRDIYTTIAKQLEMPAQMGDCLAAVEFPEAASDCGIDRRCCKVSWATAFGLSLS